MDSIICGVITAAFVLVTTDASVTHKSFIINSLFINNWYTTNFIILIMISPILERIIEGISYETYTLWIIILAVVNICFGYGLLIVNTNGYNYVNFVFLYLLGRYLHLYENKRWCRSLSKASLILYAICTVCQSIGFLFYQRMSSSPESIRFWSYNNPFVILSAVTIIVMFSKVHIQSRVINKLSKGTFYVFLLHTTPLIQPIRNTVAGKVYKSYGYFGIFGMGAMIFVGCLALGILLQKISELLTYKIDMLCQRIIKGENEVSE